MAVDENELKKLIQATAEETRRHFDTVTERIRTEVQIVAEGVVANRERTEQLSGELGQLKETVEQLVTTVAQLDTRVGKLDKKVDRLDKKFDRVATDLEHRIEHLERSTN